MNEIVCYLYGSQARGRGFEGALVQPRGREKKRGGHYCPRFGGATVWEEIDGCKQQITACSVKGDLKKARDCRENWTPPVWGCAEHSQFKHTAISC